MSRLLLLVVLIVCVGVVSGQQHCVNTPPTITHTTGSPPTSTTTQAHNLWLCPPGYYCNVADNAANNQVNSPIPYLGTGYTGSGATGTCVAFSSTSGGTNQLCTNPGTVDGTQCAPPSGYALNPYNGVQCTYTAGGTFSATQTDPCYGYACLHSGAGTDVTCTAFQYAYPTSMDIKCDEGTASSSAYYPFGNAQSPNSVHAYDGSDPTKYYCDNSATVHGDPQFTGLRGQSFQIHGIDGAFYNIISHPTHQVNSKFGFLTAGQCPPRHHNNTMLTERRARACWSHPGSYITQVGVQQWIGSELIRVVVTAGPARVGFDEVIVNGKSVTVGHEVMFSDQMNNNMHIQYTDSHFVVITTPLFTYELDNSDTFINQATTPNVRINGLQTHGLLGQTWSSKTYNGTVKYIEGEVDDYFIGEDDIFGTDFVFNLFQNK